jgi:predicted hydrocarbon binding protein
LNRVKDPTIRSKGVKMAEIKGVLLNGWAALLKERYGEEAINAAIIDLSAEDRAQVAKVFLDSSWYPYETLHALRKLTRTMATPADADLSVEIGGFMAKRAFSGVYHSLLAKDPVKQVEKFSWISEFFFRETRQLKTEVEGKSCIVRYSYEKQATPTRPICQSMLGFWKKTLEMSGASAVECAHTECVTNGAAACVFKFIWK